MKEIISTLERNIRYYMRISKFSRILLSRLVLEYIVNIKIVKIDAHFCIERQNSNMGLIPMVEDHYT